MYPMMFMCCQLVVHKRVTYRQKEVVHKVANEVVNRYGRPNL